ncbi:MAG TPA: hypothetical protein VFI13_08080 [Gemmatimonadales bacterium]|nr:hypothetical protein [Gemmatimonadales bacterium]
MPLMGQSATVVSVAPAFPYGTYDSPQPADENHAAPRTLRVELTQGWMKVYDENGQLVQTFATVVSGRHFRLSRLSGACSDPQPVVGDYTWSLDHDVLSFALVSDPCPGRGEKIARVHLTRSGAVAASVGPPAAAVSVGGFPLGRYTLQALDSIHAPPAGLVVEFTETTVKVWNGEQLVETHGMTVDGQKWQIFEFGGNCSEPGDYLWHAEGNTLWMTAVNDPCADRMGSITSVKFIHQ